jgi:hypothetical protein
MESQNSCLANEYPQLSHCTCRDFAPHQTRGRATLVRPSPLSSCLSEATERKTKPPCNQKEGFATRKPFLTDRKAATSDPSPLFFLRGSGSLTPPMHAAPKSRPPTLIAWQLQGSCGCFRKALNQEFCMHFRFAGTFLIQGYRFALHFLALDHDVGKPLREIPVRHNLLRLQCGTIHN